MDKRVSSLKSETTTPVNELLKENTFDDRTDSIDVTLCLCSQKIGVKGEVGNVGPRGIQGLSGLKVSQTLFHLTKPTSKKMILYDLTRKNQLSF